MNLAKRYHKILTDLGFNSKEIAIKWKALDVHYSKKSRHYHGWKHIEAMVASWIKYQSELENPIEVLLAIYYHDIIYSSTRKDNELRSAELAQKELAKTAKIDLKILYNLIMRTKNHDATTNDEKWLVDFDLKILGSTWENYAIYCKQIRKEYRIYPNFIYNPGRKKALDHFLEKEFIYQTEKFRKLYEKQARENLKREIDLLQ